jgi:DNA-binding beta-propeller fold protein YncE
VATLGSEAPGAGRVYVLNARSGKVVRVIRGLDSPTGVAVDPRGNVYVSNVIEGAPVEPPPDFDPSEVGDITKIRRDGSRSVAQVTMPNGLLWKDGALYASAWSIAGFLGIADAGQVVKVSSSAFEPSS